MTPTGPRRIHWVLAGIGGVIFAVGVAVIATSSGAHGTANGIIYCAVAALLIAPLARRKLAPRKAVKTAAPRVQQPSQPAVCTRGWVAKVPYGAGPLVAMTEARFEGYRGHCDCGWRGASREHFPGAQRDIYEHNGAIVSAPDGWDRW